MNANPGLLLPDREDESRYLGRRLGNGHYASPHYVYLLEPALNRPHSYLPLLPMTGFSLPQAFTLRASFNLFPLATPLHLIPLARMPNPEIPYHVLPMFVLLRCTGRDMGFQATTHQLDWLFFSHLFLYRQTQGVFVSTRGSCQTFSHEPAVLGQRLPAYPVDLRRTTWGRAESNVPNNRFRLRCNHLMEWSHGRPWSIGAWRFSPGATGATPGRDPQGACR